jgi:ABC-type multidrug transport system permease subunit
LLTANLKHDGAIYVLALLLGVGTGSVDIAADDLLLTALAMTAACMFLGLLRPRWPWRWVMVVGVAVPLTELASFLLRTIKPSQAQIYGSFLAFLPGVAGAYGGAFLRRVVEQFRAGK